MNGWLVFSAGFMAAFIVGSLIYSYLAAFSTVFYRSKLICDLGRHERDIMNGRASAMQRLFIFFLSLYYSTRFPPLYVIGGISGGTTLLAWMLFN